MNTLKLRAFYKKLQDFEHFGIVKPRNNRPYEARPFLIVVNIPLIPHILTWSLNCCVRGGIEALAGKGGRGDVVPRAKEWEFLTS